MASKKKNQTPAFAPELIQMLTAIAAACADPAKTFLYVPEAMAQPLAVAALIELNAAMRTAEGNIPAKITAAGSEFLAKLAAPAAPAAPAEAKVKPTFEIEKGIPIPAIKRGGGHIEAIYPFDTMEVGDSFFIPVSAEKPEPVKSLASTVASANQRYAIKKVDANGQPVMRTTRRGNSVQVLELTRTFVVRASEKKIGDATVKGARIFREK